MKDDKAEPLAVQDILARIKDQAQEMLRRDERHLRWALGIKIIILAFIAIYMGWAYVNFRMADADLLVVSAQQKFYEELPTLKTAMVANLNRMAPSIIDRAGDQGLKSVPELANQLEAFAQDALSKVADSLEKDITARLSSFIYETRDVIDETFPDLSSYEKMTRLRMYALEEFREAVKGVGEEIGDSMREHSLAPRLRYLLESEHLTEKEKLQREIIGIWYLLMDYYIDACVSSLDLKDFRPLGSAP